MPILPKSYVNFAQKSVLFYRSVNFIFGKKIVPQGILTPVRPSFFCLFLYYFPLFTNSAFICHAASASPFSPHPRLSFCTQVRRNRRKILPPFTPKGKPLPVGKQACLPPYRRKRPSNALRSSRFTASLPRRSFCKQKQVSFSAYFLEPSFQPKRPAAFRRRASLSLSLLTQIPPFTSGDVRRHSVFHALRPPCTLSLHLTRGFFSRHSSPHKEQPCRRLHIASLRQIFPLNDPRRTDSPKKHLRSVRISTPLAAKSSDKNSTCPCQRKSLRGHFTDHLTVRRRFCCIILCLVVFLICF